MAARLAGTLVGGVWADRCRRAGSWWPATSCGPLSTLATAGYFATGQDSVPLLCGLAAVTGGAAAFFGPAFVSLRPLLVAVDRRHAANATLNILQNSAFILGPAAAGVFVAWAGAPWAFVVNAVSFLVSAATVAAIRVEAPRAPRVGMLAELREGWHEVTSRSWLLAGLLAATAYHAAFGAVVGADRRHRRARPRRPDRPGLDLRRLGRRGTGGWPAGAAAAAAAGRCSWGGRAWP